MNGKTGAIATFGFTRRAPCEYFDLEVVAGERGADLFDPHVPRVPGLPDVKGPFLHWRSIDYALSIDLPRRLLNRFGLCRSMWCNRIGSVGPYRVQPSLQFLQLQRQ